MPLSPNFPTDPFAILDPGVRWYPGDELLVKTESAKLIPPLVEKVRKGVKAWRDNGYAGASDTTRALLNWWFGEEHLIPQADGTAQEFRWYFAQREAVESVIWLYEVEAARDPYALMSKYDSSHALSRQMFAYAMQNMVRAQDHALLLGRKSAVEKVVAFLMEWAEHSPRSGTVALAMTRQDIADYLGLTIETVSRTLSQLERDAMIELPSARQIRFKDPAALRALNA